MDPKDEISALEEALSSIPQLLSKRAKALDERAKEVEAQKEQLEKEKKEMGLNFQPSDVLRLNIGGDTTLAVLRKTITSVEGSMLSSRFSGRWDESLEKDKDGNFFIDQPIEIFKPMVDYLRARQCETPLSPPVTSPDVNCDFDGQEKKYRDFLRMVEYYGMTPGIYPTKVCLYSGREADSTINHHKVVATEYSAFTLELHGHSRQVVAFEVKLDNTDAFQIGWTSKANWPPSSSAPNQVGLAENTGSLGLDMARQNVRLNGSVIALADGFSSGRAQLCAVKSGLH
jgi:hypothetical protein